MRSPYHVKTGKPTIRSKWPRIRFTDAAPDLMNERPGQPTPRRSQRLPQSDETPTKWGFDASATEPTIPSYMGTMAPGNEVAGVTGEITGTPGYGPTQGGGGPDGMKHTLLGAFPVEGDRYNFWPISDADGTHIFRVDMQSNGDSEEVATFPHSADSYLHTDQTATDFRVWKVGRDQVKQMQSNGKTADTLRRIASRDADPVARAAREQASAARIYKAMNPQATRDGIAQGRDAAKAVNEFANRIAAINEANRKLWGN